MSDIDAEYDLPSIDIAGGDSADALSGSPQVRDLYKRGSQIADVDFTDIENRNKRAIEQKKAALQRGYENLMAQKQDNTALLMALSKGFLSPTKTGSFAESLGNVAGEAAPVLDRQRQIEQQRREALDKYQSAIADVDLAGSKDEYARLARRAQLGQDLMRRAAEMASREQREREKLELRRDLAQVAAGRDREKPVVHDVVLSDEQAARMGVPPGAHKVTFFPSDPQNTMQIVGGVTPKGKPADEPPMSDEQRKEAARRMGVPLIKFDPTAGLPKSVAEAFLKEQNKKSEKELGEAREAVSVGAASLADFDRFAALLERQKTGGIYGTMGVGSLARGLEKPFNPDLSEMEAITNKIAPMMRIPGSGATSDKDLAGFLTATVGADKPVETNKAIIQAARVAQKNLSDRLAFFEMYASVNKGSLRGAAEHWQRYLEANPIFNADASRKSNSFVLNSGRKDWRQFFREEHDAEGKAPSGLSEEAEKILKEIEARAGSALHSDKR